MIIRRAIPSDLTAILALERSSETAAHWSEQQYRDLFSQASSPARVVWVAEEQGPGVSPEVLGFLVSARIDDEWELENIVVVQGARRNGVGRRLLDALLAEARQTNNSSVFLEVRESNSAARALYEKSGFIQAGRRRAYYQNPEEDAILYRGQPSYRISE